METEPEYYTIDAPSFRNPAKKFRVGNLPAMMEHWRIPSSIEHKSRLAIERIGYFIKRERDYDFPPYDGSRVEDGVFAHLFAVPYTHISSRAVGAAVFSADEPGCKDSGYCLEWVWIHPYFRRDGILTRAWEVFRRQYGDFSVAAPYSPSMLAFLKKVQHPCRDGEWSDSNAKVGRR
jgi:hypothetical protein